MVGCDLFQKTFLQDLHEKALLLAVRSHRLGLVNDAGQLYEFSKQLSQLSKASLRFDLASAASSGRTLLVGEGNFSFSRSLVEKMDGAPAQLVATSLEALSDISEYATDNIEYLRKIGVTVFLEIDATSLVRVFEPSYFESIIFQFPHTGNRLSEEGMSSNHVLVRDFLKNARVLLSWHGRIFITVVENAYYRGAFQMEKAAAAADVSILGKYPFDPADFPGYVHTMTNHEESALDSHSVFSTWVFGR